MPHLKTPAHVAMQARTTVLYPQYWRQPHLSILRRVSREFGRKLVVNAPRAPLPPEEEDMSLLLVVRAATLQP
jgi:hypothetical protein